MHPIHTRTYVHPSYLLTKSIIVPSFQYFLLFRMVFLLPIVSEEDPRALRLLVSSGSVYIAWVEYHSKIGCPKPLGTGFSETTKVTSSFLKRSQQLNYTPLFEQESICSKYGPAGPASFGHTLSICTANPAIQAVQISFPISKFLLGACKCHLNVS